MNVQLQAPPYGESVSGEVYTSASGSGGCPGEGYVLSAPAQEHLGWTWYKWVKRADLTSGSVQSGG